MNKKPPFSINSDQSGSALKDFATLLDFIQEGQYRVSKKLLYISPKGIIDLNERMTNPMQHDFKRPSQPSFFHINLLYQTARKLGLFSYKSQSANKIISLNNDVFDKWNNQNNTEKYFQLLEACVATNGFYMSIGSDITHIDKRYLSSGKNQLDTKKQKHIKDMLLLPALACLELLGLCDIQSDQPDPNSGWKIKSLEKTMQGEFILSHLKPLIVDPLNSNRQKKSFHEVFSPFFPEYKKAFTPAAIDPTGECDFIFKVSLSDCWRRIALNHKSTLDHLAGGILHYFDFANDHLHEFSFMDSTGQRQSYPHYAAIEDRDACASNKITLAKAGLKEGMEMTFLFDFGDDWRFNILLETIRSPSTIDDEYVECYLSVGEAPEQYSDYDEDY